MKKRSQTSQASRPHLAFVKYILLYTILVFTLGACRSKENIPTGLPQITIDIDNLPSISFHELFSEIELIPLSTDDSSLIGIYYPLFTDSGYFLRDNTQQELAAFKENGKFTFKISKQGKGPGQYNYLSEIAYNPFSKHIYLIEYPNKVHTYDMNGKFIHAKSIDSCNNIENIIPISSDTLLIIDGHGFSDYCLYACKENRIINKIKDPTYHLGTQKFYAFNNDNINEEDNPFIIKYKLK